jgi:hypothetical protein
VAASEPALPDLTDLDPAAIMITAHRERYGTDPDPLLLAALGEILAGEASSANARA